MDYLKLGINAIAVNASKQAIFGWKKYQTELITEKELEVQMADARCKGIAIICGEVSGNLEVIDIDTKYQTYELWEAIRARISDEIYAKLHVVRTRNNGYHLAYRCEAIEGNLKLATRPASPDELKRTPASKTYCIIETRGEGGYVVAPPTEGYEVLQEGINVLEVEEREELMSIMRSFNEVMEEAVIEAHDRPSVKEYGLSPFDDYNRRADIGDILRNHGWQRVGENSERIFMLRPGGDSSAKHSGSWNKDLKLFSVFSTNTPFKVGVGYRKVAVFCILECNGDFKECVKG